MEIRLFNQKLITFCLMFVLISLPLNLKAQKTRELTQDADDKKVSPKRIALVIGNGAYTKAKSLPNPPNDAVDMAKALSDLGFEVISGINQTKRQTENLIREFGAKLADSGGTGLFYYAGHGIQVGGENYLVPVDADIPEEDEVAYSAVPVSLVLAKMTTAKNDLNIVILDACRNNPFARSWRGYRDSSSSDGLAKISPPTGTLVLYATEPGKVASDGAGRNGLFTEALLKQIKRPAVEYDQMVKALSADVWQKSNKQQLPWKEGNTLQDFYFAETKPVSEPVPGNSPKDATVEKNKTAILEGTFWSCVTSEKTMARLSLSFLPADVFGFENLVISDENYRTEGNKWSQKTDGTVRLSMAGGFSIWNGTITKDKIEGTASNQYNTKWNWSCVKSVPVN